MSKNDIQQLILGWGAESISSEFGEEEMTKDVSLIGLDSIDFIEFCQYLESKLGIDVDHDWVMEFETLRDLALGLEERFVIG